MGSEMCIRDSGTWDLTIPAADALIDNLYQVIATLTDAAGNISTDPGVDELWVDTSTPSSPGVTSLVTNDVTPVISGTAIVGAGETLSVEVNGVVYTVGDGNLIDNGDGSWDLTIPAADALAEGNYDVVAMTVDAVLNASTDPSSEELEIDLTAPVAPTVTAQLSNSETPVISGTATVGTGETLSVEVNGVVYTAGDGHLLDNGDGSWTLMIPVSDALPEGINEVIASVTDAAGNSTSDNITNELFIDLTFPDRPIVLSQITNSRTPTIRGMATIGVGEIFSVEVNDIAYLIGDGNLISNSNDDWELIIPEGRELPEGLIDVTATVVDMAGNSINDSSNGELLIDLTPPPAPGVTSQTTNDSTPTITGTVAVMNGLLLTVEVNGVLYRSGDGNLMDNADGTWELTIPLQDALPDQLYQVVATLVDPANNISVDPGFDELVVDTVAPQTPGVTSLVTNDVTPTVSGLATVAPGDTLSVEVNGVVYRSGDGNLVDNADGTWNLTIPSINQLAEGVYNVTATVADAALNLSTDPSSAELLVDLTAPDEASAPPVITNDTTPVISGIAFVGSDETLTVNIRDIVYTAGDGNLIDNGNGTWTLIIPNAQALPEGSYAIEVTVTDIAGNSTTSINSQGLVIDTTPPTILLDGFELQREFRPDLSGISQEADGTPVVIRNQFDEVVCSASVEAGRWSCIPFNDLMTGSNMLNAEIVDAAGNVLAVDFNVLVSNDFDSDGIPNSIEGFGDSDNDGVLDSNDLDADNDGLPDSLEQTGDSDSDGIPDYLDSDSDNDGISDLFEANGSDSDNDFLVDEFFDVNGDGLSDDLQVFPLSVPDTDADGVPDYLDLDSDQDGVPDVIESQNEDIDQNGRIDNFLDNNNNGVDDSVEAFSSPIEDTDADGVPNYLDLDSDNDGLSDIRESNGADLDEDSIVDSLLDADRDSIPDSVDVDFTGGFDEDGDGIDDRADADFLIGDDTDGDGIIDRFDPDRNGDGYADDLVNALSLGQALPDTDADGVPDLLQANNAVAFTGLRGGIGCSIVGSGKYGFDSTLVFLFALSLLWLGRGRIVKSAESTSLGFIVLLILISVKTHAVEAGSFGKR